MSVLTKSIQNFLTAYKEENARGISDSAALEADDVVLKILSTSALLLQELKSKAPRGQIIPFHPDDNVLRAFREKKLADVTGKMDERFVTFGWERDKEPNVVLFAFTLPLLDPHTALISACRILRASEVEKAHIVCLQWKEGFIRRHEELESMTVLTTDDFETYSYELALQNVEFTDYDDFFVARMEFPKIQFQDDWSSFAGDA